MIKNNKTVIASLVLSALLAGCGGDSGSDNGGNDNNSSDIEYVEVVSAAELPEMTTTEFYLNDGSYTPVQNASNEYADGSLNVYYHHGHVNFVDYKNDSISTEDDAATVLTAMNRAVNELYPVLGYNSSWDMMSAIDASHNLLLSARSTNYLIKYDMYLDYMGSPLEFLTDEEMDYSNNIQSSSYNCYLSSGERHYQCRVAELIAEFQHYKVDGHIQLADFANRSVAQFNNDYDGTLAKILEQFDDFVEDYYNTEDKLKDELSILETDYVNKALSVEVVGSSSLTGEHYASAKGMTITIPENLYTQKFYYKVIKHELVHVYFNTFSGRNMHEISYFGEGIAVFFAGQPLYTWEELSNQSTEYFIELSKGSPDSIDYDLYGTFFQYLTIADNEADARLKHSNLLRWVKEGSTLQFNNENDGLEIVETLFNEIGFTDHKGNVMTYQSFHEDLTTLAYELSQDPNKDNYKSLGHDGYGL